MNRDTQEATTNNRFEHQWAEITILALLCIAVLGIYFQTTRFDFISLDDDLYVYKNQVVLSGLSIEGVKWAFTAFHSANWHPLTWISHMIDVQLFGQTAGAHHAINVLFHLLNSVLVYAVFKRFVGESLPAAAIAMLFAVHPMHVESVAWISERKDLLSTLFFLLALLAYERYVRAESKRQAERPFYTAKAYWLVVLIFAFGLMAKPMLVTFPFVLLLLDVWPLGRFRGKHDVLPLIYEKIPMFVLSAASSWVTFAAQRSGGAVQSLEVLPLSIRMENAIVSYAAYVGKMFYPVNLQLGYPYTAEIGIAEVIGSAAVLLIITVLSILLAKRHAYLITGWLFFLGTLVPVIGLVQVGYQSMADRYTYIPYLGLFLMVVLTLRSIFARVSFGATAFAILVLAASAILAFVSYRQVGHWKNSKTIYRHSLSISKKHVLAANNLCFLLVDQDRIDEAKEVCGDSMQYAETFPLLYINMGIVSLKAGDIDEAKSNFEKYLRWVPYDGFGHFNLATVQLIKQDPIAAESSLARAASLNRGDVPAASFVAALTHLSDQFSLMSDHGKAADALRRLLYLDPENTEARYKLANTLYVSGDLRSAREEIGIAEQMKPDDPNIKILAGKILEGLGEKTLALERFEAVMKADPANAEARENIRKLRGGK